MTMKALRAVVGGLVATALTVSLTWANEADRIPPTPEEAIVAPAFDGSWFRFPWSGHAAPWSDLSVTVEPAPYPWSIHDSIRAMSLAPSASGSYVAPDWLGGDPGLATWITTGAIGAGWLALYIDGDTETIADIGDYTQMITGAYGLGVTLGTKDWQGAKQFALGGLTTFGVVHFSKEVNQKYRPDATDTKSFPSGHTAASFYGAGYVMQRYGAKWGIPALVMSSYTGYSRIQAQKHFTDDVISGMSVGLMANFLFTKPADAERAARAADLERPRRFRFEWEHSEAAVGKNVVQAPKDTGTVLDFEFDEQADPQITASVAFDADVTERHSIRTRYTPFEIRDVGTLTEDTRFGTRVFAEGTDVFSVYFLGDLRIRYAYRFLPDSPVELWVGGGLTYINTDAVIAEADLSGDTPQVDEDTAERVNVKGAMPLLYLHAGGQITKLIGLYLEADGFSVSEESFLDAAVKLRFRINSKWDVAAGWREVRDELEFDELRNEFERGGALIHVAYSF